MKKAGFSLLEVLVALLILATAYTALLHLHTLALRSLNRSKAILEGTHQLELFLAGKRVKGVKTEKKTFRKGGFPVQEVIHKIVINGETVYFRLYEKP